MKEKKFLKEQVLLLLGMAKKNSNLNQDLVKSPQLPKWDTTTLPTFFVIINNIIVTTYKP